MKTELENNYNVFIDEGNGNRSSNGVLIDYYSKVIKELESENKFITFNMVFCGEIHSITFCKDKIIFIYPIV